MSESNSHLYEFGPFRLDTEERCLVRDGCFVPLTPKAFELLHVLVRKSGRVVTKDELMKELWPDAFVEEGNLTQHVFALRKALGENHSEPQFIETVARRGYRFRARVSQVRKEDSQLVTEEKEQTSTEAETAYLDLSDRSNSASGGGLEIVNATQASQPGRTPSTKFLIGTIRAHMSTVVLALATLTLTGIVISFGWSNFAGQRRPRVKPAAPFQAMSIMRLTNTGKVSDAAISPDGRYVVHVMHDSGQQSLWMRHVATSSNVQIVPPADVVYKGLTFSRDGNYVYFVKWDKETFTALYQMPVLGGVARKLVGDIDSAITFSPDDRQFAFLRGDPNIGESALIVANSDGSSERKVAVRKEPDFFPSWFDSRNAPAWSLDGKVIACPAGGTDASGRYMTVLEVNVGDEAVRPITSQRWWQIESVEWLRDDSGLVLNAREQASSPFQIWSLSYPGGGVRRITNDLNDYRGMSLTADSEALATVQSDQVSNISIARTGDTKDATQLTSGKFDGIDGISWTPDGKIVYASRASGNSDIWVINQDGNNQKQLTADAGNNSRPAVSADGRYIVFTSDRTGTDHIWRMNLDGSNSKQLTNGNRESSPDCSPDGQWVVYNSGWPSNFLWKVPIDGGDSRQVIDRFSLGPAISPDGRLLASFYWDTEAGKVAVYPFAGGQPIRSFEIWTWVHWTPDGRGLAYIDRHNLLNLTSQPIDGSPAKPLTDFKDGRIFNFAWSRDGKQLALARGTVTNDVVLISNFKGQQ